MSVVYWVDGGADGNWNTGANWSSGSVPANSDTAVIANTNRNLIGATVASTGLIVQFAASFGGTIGADSALVFPATASISYAGTGSYANFSSSGTVTAADLQHAGAQLVVISGGTWTTLNSATGTVQAAAAAVITNGENGGGQWTIGYNATALTTFRNMGRATVMRNITTHDCESGGTTIQQDNGNTNATLCTTTVVHAGGYYNKQSTGTDVTNNILGQGRFNLIGNLGGVAGTVALGTVKPRRGAIYSLNAPGINTTFTLAAVGGAATPGF